MRNWPAKNIPFGQYVKRGILPFFIVSHFGCRVMINSKKTLLASTQREVGRTETRDDVRGAVSVVIWELFNLTEIRVRHVFVLQ